MNESEITEAKAPSTNNKRRRTLVWTTSILLIIALCWLLYWFFYLRFYESTDDAYANGSSVVVNSAIPGSVIAFYADDTDLVVEGQLLVSLDPTLYQVIYEKELRALAATVLTVKQLYGNVLSNQANVEVKKVAVQKTKRDFENRSELIQSQAIAKEDFTHSHEDLLTAKYDLSQAEYLLQIAKDAVGPTAIENHPKIEEQKAKVRDAFYHLKHCSIYAPATGYVVQRSVEVGQSVMSSTQLMVIIPKDYVWVDANFKETQLTSMRVGQSATVWFDLYGSNVKFRGKVLGIASGTGSVFSLIPPQNATGNWIKIVQRLPVRVSLDPKTVEKFPMRLGISANVDVDITDQSLPMLSKTPGHQPIATTKVFTLEFDEVNRLMDTIIKNNL